eukprot:NODE_2102_length_1511_cov_131.455331_g2001_i0.p1 GENE.NODE_2102_length_1511_cov_131.455331_g2001_i0~~NODE_2102_length_1511_cov_131.455331_g2001_i0.p1  ORF type:complete len:430 (+),score=106.63 NODE_2102_length_1511_cov_131.455331_g2001_i0:52-1290(+)
MKRFAAAIALLAVQAQADATTFCNKYSIDCVFSGGDHFTDQTGCESGWATAANWLTTAGDNQQTCFETHLDQVGGFSTGLGGGSVVDHCAAAAGQSPCDAATAVVTQNTGSDSGSSASASGSGSASASASANSGGNSGAPSASASGSDNGAPSASANGDGGLADDYNQDDVGGPSGSGSMSGSPPGGNGNSNGNGNDKDGEDKMFDLSMGWCKTVVVKLPKNLFLKLFDNLDEPTLPYNGKVAPGYEAGTGNGNGGTTRSSMVASTQGGGNHGMSGGNDDDVFNNRASKCVESRQVDICHARNCVSVKLSHGMFQKIFKSFDDPIIPERYPAVWRRDHWDLSEGWSNSVMVRLSRGMFIKLFGSTDKPMLPKGAYTNKMENSKKKGSAKGSKGGVNQKTAGDKKAGQAKPTK